MSHRWLLLLWCLDTSIIKSIDPCICSTCHSSGRGGNPFWFWHHHVFGWVHDCSVHVVVGLVNLLVKCIDVLIEMHVVLIILHLRFVVKNVLIFSSLWCVFLLIVFLGLVMITCTIIPHLELLTPTLAFILNNHTLIYRWFDLLVHTLVHVISWRLSNGHISSLVENHLVTISLLVNNSLILICWALFFRIQRWTFWFLYEAAGLRFIYIYLVVWASIELLSHLVLLIIVLVILAKALNIKRPHVFVVSCDPTVCSADHHFLGNVWLSYHVILHLLLILSLILWWLLSVVEWMACEMLTSDLLLVDTAAVLFAHWVANSVWNAVYHLYFTEIRLFQELLTYLLFTSPYAITLNPSCLVMTWAHVVLSAVDISNCVLFLTRNLITTLHEFGFPLLLGLIDLSLRIAFRAWMLHHLLLVRHHRLVLDQCLCLSCHSLILLWLNALLLHQLNAFIVLHHLSLRIHLPDLKVLSTVVGVRSCHVMLLLICVELLVLTLVVNWFYFVRIQLIILMRQLRFDQIHLRSKLGCLFQWTIVLAWVAGILGSFDQRFLDVFISTYIGTFWLIRSNKTLSGLITSLRSEGCVKLICVSMASYQWRLLVRMNLRIPWHYEIGLYRIQIITLTPMVLIAALLFAADLICCVLVLLLLLHGEFQVHYHLLLLVMQILVRRWLRIEIQLTSVDGLLSQLGKVGSLRSMIWCEATCLVVDWRLGLLAVLTVRCTVADGSAVLLVLGVFLLHVHALFHLAKILRVLLIHVVLVLCILIKSLLLPAIVCIINLICCFWLRLVLIDAITLLYHISIMIWMVARNQMMRLQMIIFLAQNKNILISGQNIARVWHWVIHVVLVIAEVLGSWFENILNLCFQFLLLLYLLLLFIILTFALSFSLVFFSNLLVNDSSLLPQVPHAAYEIHEFEVASCLWALVSEPTFFVCGFGLWFFFTIHLTVIQHVYTYKIGHFIIHLLAFAQLEGQILVFFFFTRFRLLLEIIEQQLRRIIHDVRLNSHQRQLFAPVQNVSGLVLPLWYHMWNFINFFLSDIWLWMCEVASVSFLIIKDYLSLLYLAIVSILPTFIVKIDFFLCWFLVTSRIQILHGVDLWRSW